MKEYNKDKESLYLMYLDANNLYGWAMSQRLPLDRFKWKKNTSKLNEKLIKNYNENSDKGYILEYPKNLHDLHNHLPFLPGRMKIEKCHKLVCNLYDRNNIRTLKQALNHGLILSYIDVNTKLRTEARNEFEKDFFKLMDNAVFGKTMENVRKHRDIKPVTLNRRRNYLVSKPNCHTTKRKRKNEKEKSKK